MQHLSKSRQAELNTSSVADIAFLMLSFFLMTTVISDEKGLAINLPEWRDKAIDHPVNERNLFKIQLNSFDELMVNGERYGSPDQLRERVRRFILNYGEDPHQSVSPEDAIVSIKTDRGTSHKAFVTILDEVQAAYYTIYAARVNLSVPAYRKLNPADPADKRIIETAKQGIPMNISLADPTSALASEQVH